MSILESIVLGFVQGAAEFLPISSSGHLVIVQALFGITQNNLAFTILLHLATFFAIFAAYYKSVISLIKEFFLMLFDIVTLKGPQLKKSKYRYYIIYIIIATIPAGIAGVLLDSYIESAFSSVLVVSIMLIVTGFVLLLGEKLSALGSQKIEELGPVKSFLVGLFQMCAIMPGLSRSGTTMTGGIVMGLSKDEALEFSFLLALPTILGSVILKAKDVVAAVQDISIVACLAGFVTALVVGYCSILLFKKIVKKGSLISFSVYCWVLGLLLLLNIGRF